jgi:hypothetical protein
MTTFIYMIIYFKNKLKRIVFYAFFINFSVSWAGSYEDFFQATQRDQVQVVSNLLSRGFDPNTVNVNAEPAIFDAWDHGALKVLESLIRHPMQNPATAQRHKLWRSRSRLASRTAWSCAGIA